MTYNLCKKVIATQKAKNTLNITDMTNKLDVFLLNNRISDTEYNELIALMAE